jgi:hypothetical protein
MPIQCDPNKAGCVKMGMTLSRIMEFILKINGLASGDRRTNQGRPIRTRSFADGHPQKL